MKKKIAAVFGFLVVVLAVVLVVNTLRMGSKQIDAEPVVVGGTDSRHYSGVADNVFRFSGTLVGADDLVRFLIQYVNNTAL